VFNPTPPALFIFSLAYFDVKSRKAEQAFWAIIKICFGFYDPIAGWVYPMI
jgi:hypothetical protein